MVESRVIACVESRQNPDPALVVPLALPETEHGAGRNDDALVDDRATKASARHHLGSGKYDALFELGHLHYFNSRRNNAVAHVGTGNASTIGNGFLHSRKVSLLVEAFIQQFN